MYLRRLRLVVFLRRQLAGIRMSALGEALSSASWATAADKASVVEWPGENQISPTPLAGVQPKVNCLSLPPTRQDLTQGQWLESRL